MLDTFSPPKEINQRDNGVENHESAAIADWHAFHATVPITLGKLSPNAPLRPKVFTEEERGGTDLWSCCHFFVPWRGVRCVDRDRPIAAASRCSVPPRPTIEDGRRVREEGE